MGAYLPKPNIHKDSFDDVNEFMACGASSMQGWRNSQEDAHNCILNFDANTSFFAVYDGHGGSEVAIYCSKYMPNLLKELEEYKNGDLESALKKAFLDIDEILLKEDVIEELKSILEAENKGEGETGEDEEEDLDKLCEESKMPLHEVLEKYKELKNKPKSCIDSKAGGSSGGSGSSGKPGGSRSLPIITTSSSSSSSSHSSSSSKLDSTDKKDEEAAKGSEDSLENKNESNSSNTNIGNKDVSNDKLEASDKSDEKVVVNGESDLKTETSKNEADIAEPNPSQTLDIKDTENSEGGSSSSATENGNLKKRFKPKIEMDSSDDDSEEDMDASYEESAESSEDNDDDDDEIDDIEEEEEDEEDYGDDDIEDEETNAFMENITEEPGKDSGCTAVVALLHGKELFVANAGDSRCVVCRGGKALDMSFDHKPEDEEEHKRIKKAGGKVTLDGRVNGGLNLSRAIGDHAYKMNVTLPPEKQMISAMPDIKKITLTPDDDFMVLACDGIWNSMTSEAVVQFISTKFESGSVDLSEICSDLFDKCLAPDTIGDGTGCDNMTAIIVKFKKTLVGDVTIDEVHKATNNTTITTITPTNKRAAIDEVSDEITSKKLKIDNSKIENSEENENKTEVNIDNHLS